MGIDHVRQLPWPQSLPACNPHKLHELGSELLRGSLYEGLECIGDYYRGYSGGCSEFRLQLR